MRSLILILAMCITGCTTAVPVTMKWPDAPERAGAFKTCADLQPLKEQPVLSDVSRVIADNYAAYHECRLKLNIWLEWYEIQRTIFEKAQ